MKKICFSVVVAVAIILTFSRCNEELPMVEDFKETAVIYGLLDASEDIHYIKINRAFIGPGSSIEIAQIPDSNYFENVEAKITEVGGQNRTWTLEDTVLYNKDINGAFYAPEQKVYYFKTGNSPLNVNASYKLQVTIDKGLSSEFIVTSETELVSGVTLKNSNSFKMNLVDAGGDYRTPTFITSVGNAAVVNATFNLVVSEFIGTAQDSIFIPWKIGESDVQTGAVDLQFNYNGQTFFDNIKNGVSDNPAITKRNLTAVKVKLTAGSSDLKNYILVNQPTSSLSQNKPTFTNLKVNKSDKNVIGIFSSRQTIEYYMPFQKFNDSYYRLMDGYTTQALCNGDITGMFLFCSHHTSDNSEPYYCN